MKLGGRETMIIASLAVHGVIAASALSAAHEKKVRRATTVSLAEQEQKKPEAAKPPPPPPPPPRPRPAPRPAAPTPAPAAPAAPAPAAPAAPVQTDTVMSNEVGMDMGTGQRPRDEVKPAPAPARPRPAPAHPSGPVKPDRPTGPADDSAGACTEPPGKPEPTLKTEIAYTDEARASGIEGRLVLRVTVDASGLVTDVVVVNSVDPALDAAAIATVKTWRFRPALACGKPVAGGQYTIARRFVLGD
ncbi:MAG TPA: energy transducer TonB [Kofleriaceae bacterium]|nr:energy transducer TonB [Kofleriaceae bacterium]